MDFHIEQPSKSGLTPESLRLYKGLESVSDQEAIEIIESIKLFSKILLEIVKV